MSIVFDGGRVPKRLAQKKQASGAHSTDTRESKSRSVKIALINNMPDAALEDTEVQFFDLLESAAGDIRVSLKLYSLPELPHSDAGRQHLDNFYFGIADLLTSRFDGVIVTGTEPRDPDLRNEPYWPALTEVLDWAERSTTSTVLSCLAAHAGVLYSDAIPRHRLPDKQFGVFAHKNVRDHLLTRGLGDSVHIPHSRWNEVRADELVSRGYEILTQSPNAGVDLFVKNKRNSLFVHFQGHPEYSTRTLLKEFRRDIKRFLRKERETFPSTPAAYFDADSDKLLAAFRASVEATPREDLLSEFPEAAVAATVQPIWQKSAAAIYRNWLHYLISKKADGSPLRSATPVVRD